MMISLQEALHVLDTKSEELNATVHREEENVALEWAVDRISKQPHHSPRSTPAYDTSAMDGFVLSSRLTENASPQSLVTFCVDSDITTAGGDYLVIPEDDIKIRRSCGHPRAVEIMTGGRLPRVDGPTDGEEFDCCVRCEDTVGGAYLAGHRHIQILKPVPRGTNRHLASSDFAKGDLILERDAVVRPKHIMALAAVGMQEVTVLPKLRVGIWSTGNEFRLSSDSDCPDVNGPYLATALRSMGATVELLGVIPDHKETITEELRATIASGRFHALISTGGVSAGEYDFVQSCVEELNATSGFHHVAIRPGHPVLFTTIPMAFQKQLASPPPASTVPFFGLPGNPIATAACFRFLVVPFLHRLLPGGPLSPSARGFLDLVNAGEVDIYGPSETLEHRDVFRHGNTIISRSGSVKAQLSQDQSPAKIKPFMDSTCWVHIPREVKQAKKQIFAL